MRRFVSLATLLVASAMLAGCPIYPVDSCYSSYDCPNGYTCDSYLGQCVAAPGDDDDDAGPDPDKPPPPPPPDRNDECATPADCGAGETCGEKGFCLPGDCTFWGCIAGFECTETPEGKSFVCVAEGTGSGGAGGSGGEASCSNNLQAPPASGTLTVVDAEIGEKLAFCLAGLQSDPSTSSLQTGGELASADASLESRQIAELFIDGQIASSENIICNADPATDVLSAWCWFTAGDLAIRQLGYESISDRPFTIHIDSWTDTAFVASATDVPLLRTMKFSGRPDTEVSEITAEFSVEVRSMVLDNGAGGDRPPPP